MSEPLISFYTPTFKRPRQLAACMASVAAQTYCNVDHLVIHDRVGLGIEGMFAAIQTHAKDLTGRYVYVLQDDDVLADERVVADLRTYLEAQGYPKVVMCKGRKGLLSTPMLWGRRPEFGKVDLGNYIVERELFVKHAPAFASGRYEADYDFIRSLWDAGVEFAWWDRIVSISPKGFGLGKPEQEI